MTDSQVTRMTACGALTKRWRVLLIATIALGMPSLGAAQHTLPREPPPRVAGDWLWAGRVSFGYLIPTGSDNDSVELGRAPTVTLDIVRALTCHLEVFGSAVLPLHQRITIGGENADIAPTGLQTGFTFKTCGPGATAFYSGMFIGGFTEDPTQAFADGSVFTFEGGFGAGVQAGVRHRLNDRLAFDGGLRWQRLRMKGGPRDRLIWNPLVLTGGLLIRF